MEGVFAAGFHLRFHDAVLSLVLLWGFLGGGGRFAHVDNEKLTIYLPKYSHFSKDALYVNLRCSAVMSRNGLKMLPCNARLEMYFQF